MLSAGSCNLCRRNRPLTTKSAEPLCNHRFFRHQTHQSKRKRLLASVLQVELFRSHIACEFLGVRNLARSDLAKDLSHDLCDLLGVDVCVLILMVLNNLLKDR